MLTAQNQSEIRKVFENLQKYQSEYDDDCFEINNGFEKIRHIALHLVKASAKVADFCEKMEHNQKGCANNICDAKDKVLKEAIPDLFSYSLQLSNCFDQLLSDSYLERIEKNRTKFSAK